MDISAFLAELAKSSFEFNMFLFSVDSTFALSTILAAFLL